MSLMLNELILVEEYDGPKMLADFANMKFYIWNQPLTKNCSAFLELDFTGKNDLFLDFLNYKSTYAEVLQKTNITWYQYIHGSNSLRPFDGAELKIVWPIVAEDMDPIFDNFLPIEERIIGDTLLQFVQYAFGYEADVVWMRCGGKWTQEADFKDSRWMPFLKSFLSVVPTLFGNPGEKVVYRCDFKERDKDAFSIFESRRLSLNPKDLILMRRGSMLLIQNAGLNTVEQINRGKFSESQLVLPLAHAKKMFRSLCEAIIIANPIAARDVDLGNIFDERRPISLGGSEATRLLTAADTAKHEAADFLWAAAARMTAALDESQILETLQVIQSADMSGHPSPRLHEIMNCLPSEIRSPKYEPFEQGYMLASFLREEMKLGVSALDVDHLFSQLFIPVRWVDLCHKVRAFAVWPENHVIVFLNRELERKENVRRTSLCHELCHVLLDKGSALPFGDLLLNYEWEDNIEKRARAFAAELLMPRASASKLMHNNPDSNSLEEVADYFKVSSGLAANQVINANKANLYVTPGIYTRACDIREEMEQAQQWF